MPPDHHDLLLLADAADDVLHLVLGLGMIALGVVLTRRSTSGTRADV